MCPTEQTDEEIVEEVEALSEKPVLEEEVSEEKVSEEEVDSEEPEFEGVNKVEDIPKGKEKNYGI